MIEFDFDPHTIELHHIVISESKLIPRLGRYFYESGPQVCIEVLAGYFERNRDDPRFRRIDPLRSAEEFLGLLRGYAHLHPLLKIEQGPSLRESAARFDGAVRHVLQLPALRGGSDASKLKLGRANVSACNVKHFVRRG